MLSARASRSRPVGRCRVPDSLHDLVHGRLLALPPESRDFLCAAAAHAHPTLSITESASGVDRASSASHPRWRRHRRDEGSGSGSRTRCWLRAPARLRRSSASREIHARLADLLEDPEARAWQLAASVNEPDDDVAAVLETGAEHARAGGRRGRRRCCSSGRLRSRRAPRRGRPAAEVEAAYLHIASRVTRREPRSLLEPVLASAAAGAGAGPGVLVALARVRVVRRAWPRRPSSLLRARREPRRRPAPRPSPTRASAERFFRLRERLDEAVDVAELRPSSALELGDGSSRPRRSARGPLPRRCSVGRAQARRPRTRSGAPGAASAQRACSGSRSSSRRRPFLARRPRRRTHGVRDMVRRREGARRRELAFHTSRSSSARSTACSASFERPGDRRGRPCGRRAGRAAGARLPRAREHSSRRVRGRAEDASAVGATPSTRARDEQVVPAWIVARAALGHLELALGDSGVRRRRPRAAVVALHRREGIEEPGAIRFVVDQIEALIELGATRGGGRAARLVRGRRAAARTPSALAAARRCRGLLAAADGRPRRRRSPRWSRPSSGTRSSSCRSIAAARCSRSVRRSVA